MFDGKLVRANLTLDPELARVWTLHRVPSEDLEGTATKTTPSRDGTPLYLVNGWYVPETLLELAEEPLCNFYFVPSGAVVGDEGTVPLTVLSDEGFTLEAVEHPPHYNTGKIEVIDFIEDQKLGFHLGNVVKYVTRAAHKNDYLEDLQKAKFYLEREIERAELT